MDLLLSAPHYIIATLVLLTIVVFFHELGHFWVARRCGVHVDVFSVGFGRELFGFTDRKGTRWKFSAIPLGGYVKMKGQSDTEGVENPDPASVSAEERNTSFLYKPLWQKAAIVFAGPAANYILAVVIFTALFATLGRPFTPPIVGGIQSGSAAETGGLLPGDRILNVAGYEIDDFNRIRQALQIDVSESVDVLIERNGQKMTLSIKPEVREIEDRFGKKHNFRILGISPTNETEVVHYGLVDSVKAAVADTVNTTGAILTTVGQMFMGTRSSSEIGGILRIGEMAGQQAQVGLLDFIEFAALISINLGLVNLFPIPLLDGGHLAFFGIEAIRGKPLSQRVQDVALKIGLAAVLSLMIFATWNDLVHFGLVQKIISLVS
jgi:regulator of sigma E protease